MEKLLLPLKYGEIITPLKIERLLLPLKMEPFGAWGLGW